MSEAFWDGFEKAAARRMDKEMFKRIGGVLGVKGLKPKHLAYDGTDNSAWNGARDYAFRNRPANAALRNSPGDVKDGVQEALMARREARSHFRPKETAKPNRILDMQTAKIQENGLSKLKNMTNKFRRG